MTPQEKRKELLSATLLKKLERRHFEAYYCPTATEGAVPHSGRQQYHMGWLHDHSRDGADKGGKGRQL